VHARGSAFVWTRRFTAALVVVALSLSGHAAGSALLPSLPGFLFAVALTIPLTLGIGEGTSALRLFGMLVGIQALLHLVFVISSDHAHGQASSMTLMPSTLSLTGHVLASIVAVAVLRQGDRILASWTALLTAAFGAPSVALPLIPARPALPVPAWDARAFSADAHLTTQVRRGPPSA